MRCIYTYAFQTKHRLIPAAKRRSDLVSDVDLALAWGVVFGIEAEFLSRYTKACGSDYHIFSARFFDSSILRITSENVVFGGSFFFHAFRMAHDLGKQEISAGPLGPSKQLACRYMGVFG